MTKYINVKLPGNQVVIARVDDEKTFDKAFNSGEPFGATVFNADRQIWQVGAALNPREVLGIEETIDPAPGAADEHVEDSPSAKAQAASKEEDGAA